MAISVAKSPSPAMAMWRGDRSGYFEVANGGKTKAGRGSYWSRFFHCFALCRTHSEGHQATKNIYKLPATPSVASARKSKKKIAAPLHLIKKALENIIPQPVVQKVNVVRKRKHGFIDIESLFWLFDLKSNSDNPSNTWFSPLTPIWRNGDRPGRMAWRRRKSVRHVHYGGGSG